MNGLKTLITGGTGFVGRALSARLQAGGHGVTVLTSRGPRGGGAFEQMIRTYRRLPIGPLGSGKQWFSHIHLKDLAEILPFLLQEDGMEGPVNCTSPNSVRNREYMETLAAVLKRRVLPVGVPGFALSAALGEFGKMLLTGQRAVPRKLVDAGFDFKYPTIASVLEDLLGER